MTTLMLSPNQLSPNLRRSLAYFEPIGGDVCRCDSVSQAKECWKVSKHDQVIIQAALLDESWVEFCQFLTLETTKPKLMLVTMSMKQSQFQLARELGFNCILYAFAGRSDYTAAFDCLASGRAFISEELASNWLEDRYVTAIMQLSHREQQIFTLTAKGLSATEVGEILDLSTKSVLNRLSGVKTKLGVKNSVSLTHVAVAYRVISSTKLKPTTASKIADKHIFFE